jgi:homocysteine S-methyltransferase
MDSKAKLLSCLEQRKQLGLAEIIVLDGGLATHLETLGADLNHFLWSAKLLIENPKLIQQAHRDYLEAGADIITTASYQASYQGFVRLGYDESQANALFELSVSLARDAIEEFWAAHMSNMQALDPSSKASKWNASRPKPLIAASLGCYGVPSSFCFQLSFIGI